MEPVHPIFQQKYVQMTIDREAQILVVKWIGFLQLEEVMEGCRAMFDIVSNHRIKLSLNDQTELKVLKASVQNYLIGEAFPTLQQAGLERIAVLISNDVFTQATVENVNVQAESERLKIVTFTTR